MPTLSEKIDGECAQDEIDSVICITYAMLQQCLIEDLPRYSSPSTTS